MADPYCIREGYRVNEAPVYDDQHLADPTGTVWQPDVYRDAGRFADALVAPTIIDIGSGSGEKLAGISAGRTAIGLDFGSNLEGCRERYPTIEWRAYDAERDDLPISVDELRGAVIVCADVVEHVVRPELLMGQLRHALDHAALVIISTPDRERLWGPHHLGPSPNRMHVREWALDEWTSFVAACGFERGVVRHTRENNLRHDHRTIECLLADREETFDRLGFSHIDSIRVTPPAAGRLLMTVRWLRRAGLHGLRRVESMLPSR